MEHFASQILCSLRPFSLYLVNFLVLFYFELFNLLFKIDNISCMQIHSWIVWLKVLGIDLATLYLIDLINKFLLRIILHAFKCHLLLIQKDPLCLKHFIMLVKLLFHSIYLCHFQCNLFFIFLHDLVLL